jgi:Glycosyl transferase family 8
VSSVVLLLFDSHKNCAALDAMKCKQIVVRILLCTVLLLLLVFATRRHSHLSRQLLSSMYIYPARPIDVLISASPHHYPGLFALIQSLYQNTANRDRLRIWIALCARERETMTDRELCELLDAENGARSWCLEAQRVRGVTFNVDWIPKEDIVVSDHFGRLSDVHNFARFYAPKMFGFESESTVDDRRFDRWPVDKLLYFDADVVSRRDVSPMFDEHLTLAGTSLWIESRQCVAAVARPLKSYATDVGLPVLAEIDVDPSTPGFNAGVLAIDVGCWHAQRMTRTVERWMHRRAAQSPDEEPIYVKGSQPPLLLAVAEHGGYERLPREYHRDGLGYMSIPDRRRLATTRVLHWNGVHKPWHERGALNRKRWQPYQLSERTDRLHHLMNATLNC